jgi:hypothetical protein
VERDNNAAHVVLHCGLMLAGYAKN